jgi:hypothetical protein
MAKTKIVLTKGGSFTVEKSVTQIKATFRRGEWAAFDVQRGRHVVIPVTAVAYLEPVEESEQTNSDEAKSSRPRSGGKAARGRRT